MGIRMRFPVRIRFTVLGLTNMPNSCISLESMSRDYFLGFGYEIYH